NPRHPFIPERLRLDAPLHSERCRQELPAGLPWASLFAAPGNPELILAVPADPAPGLSGDLAGSRALLLDIEGTTTPIDFVYGTLFPYARARAEDFLSRHHESDDVRADLEALRQQRAAEAQLIKDLPPWREDSTSARLASAAAYVQWLMDHDRKLTALKSLQGKIWEAGYRGGELRGVVYSDLKATTSGLTWKRCASSGPPRLSSSRTCLLGGKIPRAPGLPQPPPMYSG